MATSPQKGGDSATLRSCPRTRVPRSLGPSNTGHWARGHSQPPTTKGYCFPVGCDVGRSQGGVITWMHPHPLSGVELSQGRGSPCCPQTQPGVTPYIEHACCGIRDHPVNISVLTQLQSPSASSQFLPSHTLLYAYLSYRSLQIDLNGLLFPCSESLQATNVPISCAAYGLPWWLRGKEFAEDTGLIPESRRLPWRRKWQPTPVFLPGKSHQAPQSMGSQRVGHDLVTKQRQAINVPISYAAYVFRKTHSMKYV